MSENHAEEASRPEVDRAQGGDRRSRRTRAALHEAFHGLVLDRRYEKIRVGDIVEDADVARSTFYEHFRDKDDLLLQSMEGMLDVLASACDAEPDLTAIGHVVAHFEEMRTLVRPFLSNASGVMPRVERALALRIERRLDADSATYGLPTAWIGMQVAAAQFALLRGWLSTRDTLEAVAVARGLCRASRGAVRALRTPGR